MHSSLYSLFLLFVQFILMKSYILLIHIHSEKQISVWMDAIIQLLFSNQFDYNEVQ